MLKIIAGKDAVAINLAINHGGTGITIPMGQQIFFHNLNVRGPLPVRETKEEILGLSNV